MTSNLTKEELEELEKLSIYQKDTRRWMHQKERERLRELRMKYFNDSNPFEENDK